MKRELCYKTSRDMKRLKELLDAGYEVVCFITYDFNWTEKDKPDYQPLMTTDVCMARYIEAGEYSSYSLSVRGHGYEEYWTHGIDYNYTFLELLESSDIQFIEPTIIKED